MKMIFNKDTFVCAGIIFVIFASFGLMGTFTSGYHLTDDYQIFEFNDILNHQSLLQSQIETAKGDLTYRFRPLYYPHRILQTYLFGVNTMYWLLYTALLGCISISLFYLGMRKFKCSILESILFICLLFIGNQIVVWQRIDPNETLGMFFLAFAFYFIVFKNQFISVLFFDTFLILASWCKESFTLIVPAFILLKLISDKQIYELTIKKTIRQNIGLLIPLFVFAVNVFIILLFVDKSGLIYIGIDNNSFIFITQIVTLPLRSKQFLYHILIFFAIYFSIFVELKNKMTKFLLDNLPLLIFLVLVVFPNIILHARSAIGERYLLPVLVSTSFLNIMTIRNIKNNHIWLYKLLVVCISLSILPLLQRTISTSLVFVSEGRELNIMYKSIEENLTNDSNILLVAQPDVSWEECVLSDNYISYYFGMKTSYLFLESGSENVSNYNKYLTKDLYSRYNNRMYSSDKYYNIVVVFNTSLKEFNDHTSIDTNAYFLHKNGTCYPVYIGKNRNDAR